MQPWADMMDGQGEGKGDSVFQILGGGGTVTGPLPFPELLSVDWDSLFTRFFPSPGFIDGIDSQYQLPHMGRREACVSSLLP